MHRAQNTPSNVTLAAVSILCSLSFIRQKLAEKPQKLFDELSNEHTFGGRGKKMRKFVGKKCFWDGCFLGCILGFFFENLVTKREPFGDQALRLRFGVLGFCSRSGLNFRRA